MLGVAARLPYLWITFLFTYVCFFAFPQTDDFCTFGRLFNVHDGNPFIEAWYLYLNWTGRYSASFFTATVGWLASVSPWQLYVTYSISLACLILLFYVACNAAVRAVQANTTSSINAAPVMYVLCLLLMPSKVEGLYWLTGSVVYFASTSVLLITVCLVTNELAENTKKIFTKQLVFTSFAILVCVGFNEFVAVTLGIWMVWYCITIFHNKSARKRIFTVLVSYFGSLGLSLLSPGNFHRNAELAVARHNIPQSMVLTMHGVHEFVSLRVLPHVPILIGAFVTCAIIGYSFGGRVREGSRRALALPVTLILSFPIHLFIYAFLTGESAPGRVFNQVYPMAIVGACLLSTLVGSAIGRIGDVERRPAIGAAALLFLGIACVSSTPMVTLASVARNFGPTWRSEQIQRNTFLESTRSPTPSVVALSKGHDPWHILEGADITDDASNWINQCVADYYHLRSVRLDANELTR